MKYKTYIFLIRQIQDKISLSKRQKESSNCKYNKRFMDGKLKAYTEFEEIIRRFYFGG